MPFHFIAVRGLLRSNEECGEIPLAREQRRLAVIIVADVVG
jgi:hypothetical protein